jgi:hypothetical protein
MLLITMTSPSRITVSILIGSSIGRPVAPAAKGVGGRKVQGAGDPFS